MKNLLSLVLGLIIGAIIMFFYCCRESDHVTSSDEIPTMGITKPRGVITPKQAKILDRAFDSRHALISSEIVKRPDNRSAWWSLEDIQDYLKYAENQSKDLGFTMNGIRVYLGAYPDEGENIGYTTMFIVPTADGIGESGGSARAGKNDIPGGDPLNMGGDGNPPSHNYPQ